MIQKEKKKKKTGSNSESGTQRWKWGYFSKIEPKEFIIFDITY